MSSTATAEVAVTLEVAPADAAKKALRVYTKYPNAANYRAVVAALVAIQKAYIAEFDIGAK